MFFVSDCFTCQHCFHYFALWSNVLVIFLIIFTSCLVLRRMHCAFFFFFFSLFRISVLSLCLFILISNSHCFLFYRFIYLCSLFVVLSSFTFLLIKCPSAMLSLHCFLFCVVMLFPLYVLLLFNFLFSFKDDGLRHLCPCFSYFV